MRSVCFGKAHIGPQARIASVAPTSGNTPSPQGLRRSLALTMALVALALAAPRTSLAVDLDALVGFGQSTNSGSHYRPNSWVPVTIYLTGQGTHGIGQLQLSVNQDGHETVYTRRVSLTDGPINQVENFTIQLRSHDQFTLFNGNAIEISVRLMLDGRSIASPRKIALPTPVSSDSYNLLGLSRDGSGIDFLGRKRLGLVHRGVNPASISALSSTSASSDKPTNGINPNATLQTLYTDPRALPTSPQGYEMVDTVALTDQPLDGLNRDQVEALKDFVRLGGLLVVSGGGDTARLKSQLLQEMLPISAPHAVSVSSLPDLETRYRAPMSPAGGLALAIGSLKPDAHTLLADASGRPLVVCRAYGAGSVVFTAFDLQDRSIQSWPGATSLWYDLLRCGSHPVAARELLRYSQLRQSGTELIDALAGVRAGKAPPLPMLVLFCGVYLVLLVPVNYVVLKKLDRREWTWLTAPALITGFTIASFLFARSLKGGELTVNSAAVVETQANSDQAAGYAKATLYSPERAQYDIRFGAPDSPDNPCRLTIPSGSVSNSGPNQDDELTVDTDPTGSVLRNTTVRLWDKRSFATPIVPSLRGDRPDLTGSVDAVLSPLADGKQVAVTVTNRTRFTLEDCYLIGQDRQVAVGRLEPGARSTRTILWCTAQAQNNITIPERNDAGQTLTDDTPTATRRRIASAVTQVMLGSNSTQTYGSPDSEESQGFGHGVNALTGWFHDPLLDVQVDGKRPRGEEVNLLVVHLTPPDSGPGRALWKDFSPFALPAVTEFEDRKQSPIPGISR